MGAGATGATLLFDSDPVEEEHETELKASAMLAAVREAGNGPAFVDLAERLVAATEPQSRSPLVWFSRWRMVMVAKRGSRSASSGR